MNLVHNGAGKKAVFLILNDYNIRFGHTRAVIAYLKMVFVEEDEGS